jgi:hypothetical protein
LLAATLLALDGDGYRSQVDAVVSARVSALIAELPRSSNVADVDPERRIDRVAEARARRGGSRLTPVQRLRLLSD